MRKTQIKEKQKINETAKEEVIHWGVAAGVAQTAYIVLVIFSLNMLRGLMFEPLARTSFSFVLFLLFFIFSAVLSVIFVFGRPVFLLFEKKIQEAVLTILTTVLTLLVILLLVTIIFLIVGAI